MIRIIIYFMKLIVALFCAIFFASCNISSGESITGSGNVTTETRNVGNFKGISTANALDVEIEQSDSFEVVVEADDNLQKHIITRVENGILVIESEINSYRNVTAKRIKIKMPTISSIEATGASSINSINTLISEDLLVDSSSAGDINLNVEAENLVCKSSSAGSIKLKGKALKADIESSSAGNVNAGDLLANDVIANSSSSGDIIVHPILTLNADASSAGSINYNVVPRDKIIQNSSSGGNISKT